MTGGSAANTISPTILNQPVKNFVRLFMVERQEV